MHLEPTTKHVLKIAGIGISCLLAYFYVHEEYLNYEDWQLRSLPIYLAYTIMTSIMYGIKRAVRSLFILVPIVTWYISAGVYIDEYSTGEYTSYDNFKSNKEKMLSEIVSLTAYTVLYYIAIFMLFMVDYIILLSLNLHGKIHTIFTHIDDRYNWSDQGKLKYIIEDFIKNWLEKNPERINKYGRIMTRDEYLNHSEKSTNDKQESKGLSE